MQQESAFPEEIISFQFFFNFREKSSTAIFPQWGQSTRQLWKTGKLTFKSKKLLFFFSHFRIYEYPSLKNKASKG